jgi:polysaccharide export outer membrane protein
LEVPRLSVDDAGFLHAPLTGAIEVAGASLEEAEALLQVRLRRYDRFGIVSLTVVEPAGHRASVLGAVARPGTYTLGSPTRVADLLATAGGIQRADGAAETVELGDLAAARLLRAGEPLPISLPRALTGDPRHNVLLAPRDVLFVPALQGAAVRVLGEVKQARLVPWRPGLRLSEVLAQAQGMTADADDADVRVVRGPLSAPRFYRASFRALLQGQATDVELARGDIVFVTKHWFASATDVIQRLVPLLLVSPVPL